MNAEIRLFQNRPDMSKTKGRIGSIPHSVMHKGYVSTFGNGFAPVKFFNAIPLPFFSAALNSAP
jgi:hypothetical protein